MIDFGMIGPAFALALSSLGSAIGCGIAGMASHGVMARVDENHGKFIGMSAMPSSQSIYGFVFMIFLRKAYSSGTLTAWNSVGIGFAVGLAIMVSAIYQGICAASGIQASAKQPAIYGKCLAALGIVESFALFAFVFGLLLL